MPKYYAIRPNGTVRIHVTEQAYILHRQIRAVENMLERDSGTMPLTRAFGPVLEQLSERFLASLSPLQRKLLENDGWEGIDLSEPK